MKKSITYVPCWRVVAHKRIMHLRGLSDSPLSEIQESSHCRCGSIARIANGLCAACLLRDSLSPDRVSIESFAALLAEIDVPDRDWQFANYQILEEIGRGGMGVIYRARERYSRRIVAVKRLLGYHSDSKETLRRFQREAQTAANLDHPNILPVYEVGLDGEGLPFFSMKFAPGGSLLQIARTFRDHPRLAVELVAKISRAVDYAHNNGILHRDLKPGNILLDCRGEPLVSDFGLAKWLDATSDLTRTMTVFGTPGYIAPEQVDCLAAKLTPAVDVYSLGAILFELLSTRPPFLGEHAVAVIHQAAETQAPRLRSILPALPRDLETVCAHCLERDPAARYPTAGRLADDLERWLEHKTIVARPVPAPTRLWRWSRRNPGFAATCAACVVLAGLSWAKFSEHRRYQASLLTAVEWQHSVTVLPFLNLDNASQDDQVAGEVVRALQSQLPAVGACRITQLETLDFPFAVAPRSEELAAIAHHAQMRKVLMGTTRLVDGKLSVSVHLLDPTRPQITQAKFITIERSGPRLSDKIRHSRGEFYEWIGASFDEVPNAKSNQASSNFLSAGRALMERRDPADIDKAIDCLEKAVAADPSSAQAYTFLATAQIGRLFLGGKPELLQLAEIAAAKSIQLEPRLGNAHRALSFVLEQKGDLTNAREEAVRAIELDGTYERSASQIASITKGLGRPDIALSWLRIMKHLQNQPAHGEFLIGDSWADLCEDQRAEQAYRQTTDLRPDLPEGWIGICHLRILNRDFASALRILGENEKNFSQFDFTQQIAAQCHFFARHFAAARTIYAQLARKNLNGGGNFYGAVSYESAIGWLDLASGKTRVGRKTLEVALQKERQMLVQSPHHPETLYRAAAIEASLGLKTSAVEDLRAAADAGWIDFRSLALDPRFDTLRDNSDFKDISEVIAAKVASLRRSMAFDLASQIKMKNNETNK